MAMIAEYDLVIRYIGVTMVVFCAHSAMASIEFDITLAAKYWLYRNGAIRRWQERGSATAGLANPHFRVSS